MDSKNYQYDPGYQQNQGAGYPNVIPVQTQPAYYDPNPQSYTQVRPKRDWSFSLFDCFEDLEALVCAFFCAPCFEYSLFLKAGEGFCDCCWAGMIPLRTKIRTERAIEGSLCKDVFAVSCCHICALVQLSNEMKATPPQI